MWTIVFCSYECCGNYKDFFSSFKVTKGKGSKKELKLKSMVKDLNNFVSTRKVQNNPEKSAVHFNLFFP